MTRRERAAVVELLLCGADLEFSDGMTFIRHASNQLDANWRIENLARLAFQDTYSDGTSSYCMLEVAQRVAEGWNP